VLACRTVSESCASPSEARERQRQLHAKVGARVRRSRHSSAQGKDSNQINTADSGSHRTSRSVQRLSNEEGEVCRVSFRHMVPELPGAARSHRPVPRYTLLHSGRAAHGGRPPAASNPPKPAGHGERAGGGQVPTSPRTSTPW
jgi:hypothetical protein